MERVARFRLAVAKGKHTGRQGARLTDAIEHLETWGASAVTLLHDGEASVYLLVTPARPVRVQAAKDIASTCPFYVPKSFKPLA